MILISFIINFDNFTAATVVIKFYSVLYQNQVHFKFKLWKITMNNSKLGGQFQKISLYS
jgi:hypothetical protein